MSKWYSARFAQSTEKGLRAAAAPVRLSDPALPVSYRAPHVNCAEPGQIGISAFLFFLYEWLIVSRAHELLLPIPRLILALGVVLLLLAAIKPQTGARAPRLWYLVIIFGVCLAVSVPFSYWPSGSLRQVYAWTPYCVLFLAGCRIVTSVRLLRMALDVLGIAYLTVVAEVAIFGVMDAGRLSLTSGTFADPNDLATLLLFSSTFGLYGLSHGRQRPVRFALFAVALLITPVLVLSTGSRGGLITMCALALLVFVGSSGRRRLVGALALPVVLLIGTTVLPESVNVRFRTLVEGTDEQHEMSLEERMARGSLAQRWEVLLQSFRMTISHPLVGVGAGQFPTASAEELELSGERPRWLRTHNAYTQVSSELGVIAFGVYLGILLVSVRIARGFVAWARETDGSWVAAGACVHLALHSYIIGSLFTSIAYHLYMPLLGMLCVGLQRWRDLCSNERLRQSAVRDSRLGCTLPKIRSRTVHVTGGRHRAS